MNSEISYLNMQNAMWLRPEIEKFETRVFSSLKRYDYSIDFIKYAIYDDKIVTIFLSLINLFEILINEIESTVDECEKTQ